MPPIKSKHYLQGSILKYDPLIRLIFGHTTLVTEAYKCTCKCTVTTLLSAKVQELYCPLPTGDFQPCSKYQQVDSDKWLSKFKDYF